jgi:hypothetical protein
MLWSKVDHTIMLRTSRQATLPRLYPLWLVVAWPVWAMKLAKCLGHYYLRLEGAPSNGILLKRFEIFGFCLLTARPRCRYPRSQKQVRPHPWSRIEICRRKPIKIANRFAVEGDPLEGQWRSRSSMASIDAWNRSANRD